jgi:allantoin racemase
MKITVINPTISTEWNAATQVAYARAARPGTTIQVVNLKWGTASIEGRADDALAAPGILACARQAAQDGASAIIIDCMNDPGLFAVREAIRIPVVGPAEASMHLASMLAHRFSILTTGINDLPPVEELVARYTMTAKFASVRALDIPVLALDEDTDFTFKTAVDLAAACIREDGAAAIIPGCTRLASMAPEIENELARMGLAAPVLNPSLVALRTAESLVSLGLVHSLRSYAPPGDKLIRYPDLISEG